MDNVKPIISATGEPAQLDTAAIIARRNRGAGVLAGEFGRRPAARIKLQLRVFAAGRCGNSPLGRLRYGGGVKLRPRRTGEPLFPSDLA